MVAIYKVYYDSGAGDSEIKRKDFGWAWVGCGGRKALEGNHQVGELGYVANDGTLDYFGDQGHMLSLFLLQYKAPDRTTMCI